MLWIGIVMILASIIPIRASMRSQEVGKAILYATPAAVLILGGILFLAASTMVPSSQASDTAPAEELFGPGSDPATWPDHGTEDSR